MNVLRERLAEDLRAGREKILCCGASALGGWFVSYHRRGNRRNISCTSCGRVTDADVAYCLEHGIKFFDFRDSKNFKKFSREHSTLLNEFAY